MANRKDITIDINTSANDNGVKQEVSALDTLLKTIGELDSKLSTFGTAEAEAIRKTLDELKGVAQAGTVSEQTISLLSASLEKFVKEADKLPPKGLKKLSGDIANTIRNTRDLQKAMAEANDIEFNVKTDGSGTVDELMHKIEVIENAKNLDDGLKQLQGALNTLDPEKAKDIADQIERIKKILEGELGKKQVKELNDSLNDLSRTTSRLGSSDLQRLSGSLASVTSSGATLGESMKKTGNAARDGFSLIDEVSKQLGASTNAVTDAIMSLLTRIKGIGPIVSRNGAAVLGMITLIYAGIKKIFSGLEEIRQNKENFKLTQLEQSIDAANREFETYTKLLDVAYNKEKMALDLKHDQLEATRELEKAQIELNRAKELEGVESETERNRINMKYDQQLRENEYAGKKVSYAEKATAADLEIENLQKQIEAQRQRIKRIGEDRQAAEEGQKESLNRAGGWWNATKRFIGGATFDLLGNSEAGSFDNDKAQQYMEKSKSLFRQRQDELVKLNELKAQLQDKKTRRDTLLAKANAGEKSPEEKQIEAENEAAKAKQRDEEAREKRRIDGINRQRSREKELYEYDREMAETNYQRGRRSPWQNEVQQLEEAEKMLKRYRQEEKEALDERERVMKEVAAQGGWQTITEEQEFRFNNATSDLVRARSSRYQEQSTIDQLRKQIHDRQFQESESRHSIEKEDADWQRGRLYNRANYAQRLRMDKAMYDKAKAEYEEANAAILADNAGTKTLSPEERQVMERRRNEARGYLTQSRDAISNAMYEGDTQTMGFFNSLMKQGNRLTQMGLGGDVANWDKQTAHNTKTLVTQNRDLLNYLRSNKRNDGMNMAWGL